MDLKLKNKGEYYVKTNEKKNILWFDDYSGIVIIFLKKAILLNFHMTVNR